MDFLITSAARALASGDPLAALNHVALRDDAPALALRGIAMAQLGDFARAKALLRSAVHAFGPKEAAARARCVVAQAEVALASRDLAWPEKSLIAARNTLGRFGDPINAAHAAYLQARRQLLIGKLDDAEGTLAGLDPAAVPPASRTVHELIAAGIAMRRVQAKTARAALTRAELAARHAGIPALSAEVESVSLALNTPVARLISQGQEQDLLLDEVETLLDSQALIVDGCRHVVRGNGKIVPLASRPVLFALVRTLAEAWPQDVPRETLIFQSFRTRFFDETHRVRLRVEIGRLRAAIKPLADITATARGFRLEAGDAEVAVLARPVADVDRDQAAVLAFLTDGQAWSSSALALALGTSQRTVQRTLDGLASQGFVQPLGLGRARRWTTPPVPGFTSSLLLPALLPGQ
ncbi:helix-turn-helix domain-containing protein [Achromobacter seleniivolatilans]|uniref:Helix-turn-helix domain-containing protein n=1 Tax=Achromobacter seleniivolatilans TaxID=3047478 RepID=A0ABY9M3Y7_9BURK|nr:helix-turn-helix domain-containing protein [Achromobacter sp. R39]WMD21714.1 helix-turn-helix domain-containing protein [Achromobacter sp. R39]